MVSKDANLLNKFKNCAVILEELHDFSLQWRKKCLCFWVQKKQAPEKNMSGLLIFGLGANFTFQDNNQNNYNYMNILNNLCVILNPYSLFFCYQFIILSFLIGYRKILIWFSLISFLYFLFFFSFCWLSLILIILKKE